MEKMSYSTCDYRGCSVCHAELPDVKAFWGSGAYTFCPIFANEKPAEPIRINIQNIQKLADKMTELCGFSDGIDCRELDGKNIFERGRFFSLRGRKMIEREHNRCHWNAGNLFLYDNALKVCTGYAIVNGNKFWHSHSWCYNPKSNQLIETTYLFDAYFGYVMSDEEAFEYCKQLGLNTNK